MSAGRPGSNFERPQKAQKSSGLTSVTRFHDDEDDEYIYDEYHHCLSDDAGRLLSLYVWIRLYRHRRDTDSITLSYIKYYSNAYIPFVNIRKTMKSYGSRYVRKTPRHIVGF